MLEYISERTLCDLVKESNGLNENMARYLFKQMINTMLYINSKGIAHRDLKLENLLITNNYELKFADFGFASQSKEL